MGTYHCIHCGESRITTTEPTDKSEKIEEIIRELGDKYIIGCFVSHKEFKKVESWLRDKLKDICK